jgi:hypothetical protein
MNYSPLSTGKQSFLSNEFHRQQVPLTARRGINPAPAIPEFED